MVYKNLIYETDERVGIIKVNRPEVRNVFNWETWMELEETLKRLHSDPNLRVGIITGVGDEAFIGGADLRMLKERSPQDAVNASKKANEILLFMESMDEPMIAAINGWALGGGCEIALACDIRIASEKAQIGQTEARVGITPGYGGNVRRLRLIGSGRAKEMIYTGKIANAEEAERIGLGNRVVKPEELDKSALDTAARIADNFPVSVALVKGGVYYGLQATFDEALEKEVEISCAAFASGERQVGMKAVLEKPHKKASQ